MLVFVGYLLDRPQCSPNRSSPHLTLSLTKAPHIFFVALDQTGARLSMSSPYKYVWNIYLHEYHEWLKFMVDTVDGRNPAPPGRHKTLQIHNGINYQPQLVNAGFLNHQQYDRQIFQSQSENFGAPPIPYVR